MDQVSQPPLLLPPFPFYIVFPLLSLYHVSSPYTHVPFLSDLEVLLGRVYSPQGDIPASATKSSVKLKKGDAASRGEKAGLGGARETLAGAESDDDEAKVRAGQDDD